MYPNKPGQRVVDAFSGLTAASNAGTACFGAC